MSDAQPHLYLVDGSSYIFRAYHRLPPLTNRHGMNTGAVYGYTAMLWKLADGLSKADGPTHMAVILDKGSSSFRNAMYDQYKAHRPPAPEDLKPQLPLIRVATRAFSIPCIEEEGLEADDIIACYTAAARQAGWKVTIVSSDKDLMQLIEDDGSVDMLDTMNDRRIDRDYVVEKFGVPPQQLGDVLALMGDSVDNVPGVPGIGPKTASQLIQEHGSLEAVLAAAPEIKKPKLRENLIAHADNARLSRELVRLVCEMNLPEPLEALALQNIPEAPLREFLEEQGWKSLLNRMVGQGARPSNGERPPAPVREAGPGAPEAISVDRSTYATISDAATLGQWIAEARAQGRVAIDLQGDGGHGLAEGLAGVSLAIGPGKAAYVPLGHGTPDLLNEGPAQLGLKEGLGLLRPLLEDESVLKLGHNLKDQLKLLAEQGIVVSPVEDVMLASFALDGGRYGHALDELVKRHFEHECLPLKAVCGTGQKAIRFGDAPIAAATEYAAENADMVWRLWQRLEHRLAAEHATRVYRLVDLPLVPVVGAMERDGVKVDRAYLAELSGTFAAETASLEERIFAAAGGPFTIGSPQQLGQVLYDRLGLKGGRKGKSGNYSTDQAELERLEADGVEVARLVLDWRLLTKLRQTYTDALQAQIDPKSGRVHTRYALAAAQTGRLSSTDPNLQNIPIRTELGAKIRNAFIAEEGFSLLSADYGQIELRLAAHIADVPQLKEAFAKGEDIHTMTAMELFGDAGKDSRGKAKTINFAILYGISSWGLAGRLGISRDEGKAMIDRYFERFPGIKDYISTTLEKVRERGYSETLFGRKTHFPNIRSSIMSLRQGAERAAINAPIQGTSADIIKRAMVRMPGALADAGLSDARMLLQVHDELVFEVPQGREEQAAEVIRDVMANAAAPVVTLDVPLSVEVGWGANWGVAH
ncbi:DNA polymerase I [Sphingomonas astaxanthinifaciens]|uniref:DNA polymerase I n=1 Tax=Sphingomonas astaxanthinifaciens DSM 22298 TaxID=1123267 RepID=A0ABQ5Z526_9SPHN|nr:DNA polymerase I [Sphingomonas astaxanthinifaciens]GLR46730.1 DNA polymerase I [Sphingomonas astaxanthinifaciens DSM 22298]